MKILIFTEGTILMHKNAAGHTREEIVKQVQDKELSVKDYSSYIPVGNSPEKLTKWKKQGAEILYITSRRKPEQIKDIKNVLKRHKFPDGKLLFRNEGEEYKDVAEKIVPNVFIEDNCESIGEDEITINHVKPTIREKIKSILVKEFAGINHLPDKIQDLRDFKTFFIIIRGPLGCGKSTIAKKLAEILNAEYIPIDRVLDEHDLTKDKEEGYISQRSFIKANEIIVPKIKKKIQRGIPIIFDGNFYWKSQIEDLIKRLDFPHFVFTLKAPLKVCIERDRQRGKTHGEDAARAVYKKATEFDYGDVIDISKSLDQAIKDILSCLPKSFSQEQRDMRKIVEEGYEKGDYTTHFRKSKKPNKMEKHFLDALIKHIPKKATVLDFGCGTGIPIDKYLVEKKLKVTGIDISQKHISLAKHNVPRGKFLKADFSRFHFGKEKFEGIISFYAIFHIPRAEHKALFLNMRKLLKKNGVILITLGTSGSEYGEEENWAGAKMAWSTYSPRIYQKMIKECGFNIIKSKFEGKAGDEEYHFWLLAQKTHQMTQKTL